jgi:hypothetical protein
LNLVDKKSGSRLTHGMRHTKLYKKWASMKNRCTNANEPSYKYYGGRGIKLCPEWYDFENFYRDMGESPAGQEIDRIDVDGDYTKSNCRWATRKVQANNRRNNHPVEYKGVSKNICEWASLLGIGYTTIIHRLNKSGWTVGQALEMEPPPERTSKKAYLLTANGQTKTFKDWSKETGIKVKTIKQRFYGLGWSPEQCVTSKNMSN